MRINNPKAKFDYNILDTIEAGVQLTGAEVKSIRSGHATLDGSFVKVVGNELYLVNAQIFPYKYARPQGYDPQRSRKLLLHRQEIISLKGKMSGSGNLTLIPLNWYTKGPLIKLSIGLARGKKQFEKRESKKRQDIKRELEREYRGKVK